MNPTKITIGATISADTKKVWTYYNTPEHITKWNFASDNWHCPKAQNDLRVGGKLSSRMEAKDGSFGFDFEGIYKEVIPFKKIEFTMQDGRYVSTTFANLEEKTEVSTTFDAENQNPIDLQKAGWQQILNNFKNYVETN
ncbi:SRPBCC family protein [Geojedonia litorea]|uniref:SRPBCC family protein n=1 Tax=Geojedonia litorea TaxID=1268269 RepID=A0ABV9N4X8_9FLAO